LSESITVVVCVASPIIKLAEDDPVNVPYPDVALLVSVPFKVSV